MEFTCRLFNLCSPFEKFYELFIILCLCIPMSSSTPINKDRIILHNWEEVLQSETWDALDHIWAVSNDTSPCSLELERIFAEGGTKRNIILDAAGKPGSGLMDGNLAWLGNYKQCVEVDDLQFCLVKAQLRIDSPSHRTSTSLNWGVCVPNECTSDAIKYFVKVLESYPPPVFKNTEVHCSTSTALRRDLGFIMTMILFALLCALISCATAYDLHMSKHKAATEERVPILPTYGSLEQAPGNAPCNSSSTVATYAVRDADLPNYKRIFLCLSLKKSISIITTTTQAPGDIQCIHAIRVISMFWIILGHQFSFLQNSGAMGNSKWTYSVAGKWFTSQAALNVYPSLDTFFFLGGLLMAYTGFKQMSRCVGRINWLWVIFHRYLRLTPSVIAVIPLYTFAYPYFGEGPMWYTRVADCQDCYRWWWTNLLYINNFLPSNTSQGCVSWTWYLATDMQLFLCGIPVIILLWRSPLIGGIALSICLTSCIVVRALIYASRDYQANQILNTLISGEGSTFMFSVKPYACATPYIVGMAMGYYLHCRRNMRQISFRPYIALLGWLVAFTIGMAVVYGLYGAFNYPGLKVVPLSKTENVMYGCLVQLAWALAIAWVVWACHFGYGGVINYFLSWKFWIPLSRLTFCAYLLHPAVIYLYTGTLTTVFYFDIINQSFLFAGFVTISYASALLLSALVEMPICSLQKISIRR